MTLRTILAFSLLPLVLLAAGGGTQVKTEYVSGTMQGIAAPAKGMLNFADEKLLRFDNLSIPYKDITRLEARQEIAPNRLHKIMALFSDKTVNRLTIETVSESGQKHLVVFDLRDDEFSRAVPVIESRSGKKLLYEGVPLESEAEAAPAAPANNSWWGDRYWKTSRNAAPKQ